MSAPLLCVLLGTAAAEPSPRPPEARRRGIDAVALVVVIIAAELANDVRLIGEGDVAITDASRSPPDRLARFIASLAATVGGAAQLANTGHGQPSGSPAAFVRAQTVALGDLLAADAALAPLLARIDERGAAELEETLQAIRDAPAERIPTLLNALQKTLDMIAQRLELT